MCCVVLLKYCRSSHHQRSWVSFLKHLLQDPRFIDASLAYCGQNTTCTNRSNDKTSLYFQTKRIHCYEKKSHTKIPTLLIFAALARSRALATQDSPVSKERYVILPALLFWCQIANFDFFSLNLSLNRLAVMIWTSVPTTRTLPPIVDQTTKAVSTSARMIWSFIKPKSK